MRTLKSKKGLMTIATAAALVLAAFAPAPAQADFGLGKFELRFTKADGEPARQAGSHPFAVTTFFEINHSETEGKLFPEGGDIKDLIAEAPEGFVGSATAVPPCSSIDFATLVGNRPSCGDDTAVGATAALLGGPDEAIGAAVYNLEPPPGVPARLGFVTSGVPLVIDVGVKPTPNYNIVAKTLNIPQPLTVFGAPVARASAP